MFYGRHGGFETAADTPDGIVRCRFVGLHADGHAVQSRIAQSLGAFTAQIKTCAEHHGRALPACGADQFKDVISHQRFAAGKADGHGANGLKLADDLDGPRGIERPPDVSAIAAMRTGVRALIRHGEIRRKRHAPAVKHRLQKPVERLRWIRREKRVDMRAAADRMRIFIPKLPGHINDVPQRQPEQTLPEHRRKL